MVNWTAFSPELYTFFVMGGVFLVFCLLPADPQRDYRAALTLAALGFGISVAGIHLTGDLFADTYHVDLFSQVFKAMLALGLLLAIYLCEDLQSIAAKRHPETYLLLTVCTLAMMMLVSAVNLLTLYVALELSSYTLYVLVSFRQPRARGVQTALRYFLIGASASAVMLFGLALLYGSCGTLDVATMMQLLPAALSRPEVIIGLTLTLGSVFFKLAVFPFHFWAPDVYEGAANPIAAYIATASKVAAIAILIRLVALGGQNVFLARALAVIVIITMTVGNLTAIAQKDLKRMLAYSSIAQGGYVLIGVLSMTPAGYAGATFYALAILLLKFSCFFVLVKIAVNGRNVAIGDLAGLHRRSPILALLLMMALFALAGIPPTIGFTGKLLLFTAAVQQGYLILVLVAMFNVVISLYYYLRVIHAAYLREPQQALPALNLALRDRLLAGVLVTVTVATGIFPAPLITLAEAAVGVLR